MTSTADLAELDRIAAAVQVTGNSKGRLTGPAVQILPHRVVDDPRGPGFLGLDADVLEFFGVLPEGAVVRTVEHSADSACSMCNGTLVRA